MNLDQVIPKDILLILRKFPKIGRKRLSELTGISVRSAEYYCRIFKTSQKNITLLGKGVALFDIHFPEHNLAAMEIVFEFLKDFKPDWLVLGGDQLNMDTISIYNKNKPKLLENKRLSKDFRTFQMQILSRLETHVPNDCKKYFIIGNHEYRIERLLEYKPQLEGLINLEKNLALENWKIIPFNKTLHIGEMCFTHGWYFNKYYASRTVQEAQQMIFVGHVHIPQTFTTARIIEAQPKQCVGTGCLCNKNPEYLRNKPNAWVLQFLYWYMFSDGTFTYYQPIIINGRCIINGKVYDGTALLQRLQDADSSSGQQGN